MAQPDPDAIASSSRVDPCLCLGCQGAGYAVQSSFTFSVSYESITFAGPGPITLDASGTVNFYHNGIKQLTVSAPSHVSLSSQTDSAILQTSQYQPRDVHVPRPSLGTQVSSQPCSFPPGHTAKKRKASPNAEDHLEIKGEDEQNYIKDEEEQNYIKDEDEQEYQFLPSHTAKKRKASPAAEDYLEIKREDE